MGIAGTENNIAIAGNETTGHNLSSFNKTAIELFTLENKNGTKLIISNFGATVISLFFKDKNGSLTDIILGYENQSDYFEDEFYFGSVVGRYANRIAGSSVVIDEVEYPISVKNEGYHLHGGDVGFNKKIFSAAKFYAGNKAGISLKYTSMHLEEGFPGELQLEVIYLLDDDDTWTVEYKAITDRTTLVNLTQHVYFNLSGILNNTITNHFLKINSEYYLPVNNMQVPTGKLENVFFSPFDFINFKAIGKEIFTQNEQLLLSKGYDHSWVLESEHSPHLKHAATVQENGSGIVLDVFTTEPAIHFYSGNFLNNIKGKNDVVYNKHSGFCLETQHFPDAPNNGAFPTTVLKPDETFYSQTQYKLSIKK